jgi:hypothetical protein
MTRWPAAPLAVLALAFVAMPVGAEPPEPSAESPVASPQAEGERGAARPPEATGEGRRTQGLELALRTGYAVPMGSLVSNTNLNDALTGAFPLWLDAGYRFPRVFLGAYLQYAQGFMVQSDVAGSTYIANGGIPASTSKCGSLGQTCNGFDVKYGIEVQYHTVPGGPFDAWLGYGIGAENLNVHPHGHVLPNLGNPEVSETLSLMALSPMVLQLGADYRLAHFGVGPFVMLDVGKYITESQSTAGVTLGLHDTALHEWLTFGVRGYFDIALTRSESR